MCLTAPVLRGEDVFWVCDRLLTSLQIHLGLLISALNALVSPTFRQDLQRLKSYSQPQFWHSTQPTDMPLGTPKSSNITQVLLSSEMSLGNAKQHCKDDPEKVIYSFLSAQLLSQCNSWLFRCPLQTSYNSIIWTSAGSLHYQLPVNIFPQCSHRAFWKQASCNSEWHCSLSLSESSCIEIFFPEQLESISLNPSDLKVQWLISWLASKQCHH